MIELHEALICLLTILVHYSGLLIKFVNHVIH